MKDFIAAKTGNRIVIQEADFLSAMRLKDCILNEIKKNALGIKIKGTSENILEKEIDLSNIGDFLKDTLIGIDTVPEVRQALFDCLKKSTYNNTLAITPELFDNKKEARQDYYEIIFACIEENLRPFISSLLSELSRRFPQIDVSQVLNAVLQDMNN